ncbi:MAG: NAD-dependent DNA ligase LigA [Bacteroidota bacterium]
MYAKEVQRQLFDLSKTLLKTTTATESAAAQEQVADLHRVIVYHEWRYYVLSEPVLSDFEYDQLYKKLEALEKLFPLLVSPDSPTQRVSNDLTESFDSVEHLTPMLSLANSYNADDLKDFDTQIRKLTGIADDSPIAYCVEPKYDGGSIALVYENDRFVRGATRGNGSAGENITNNLKSMRSVPLRASFSKSGFKKVELRGEAVIRKDRFDQMNEARAKAGKQLFANPRNTAAGGLRTKDPKETANRQIEAFVYQMGYAIDVQDQNAMNRLATHGESIDLLGNLGFKVPVEEKKVCKNIEEVIEFCVGWEDKRAAFPYEIDGMVVKVNELALQEKCGYTSHHPRWAIAFKFKAKQATSKLVGVEFQVGKIGSVTPVAKLEPVQLAGVTVSSVSLHNADFISSRNIKLGDTVLVERAGDVIPYIVKAMDELRDGSEQDILFPSECPVCTTTLIRQENEAAWRCENYSCKAQVVQRMIHHVSKDAMDIDGFGKSYVERFYELGWLKNIADIYRLDYEQIAQLEGFGKKSAANLKKSIDKAKQNPISRFLHSLSIHHLGKKVSQLLAAEIQHVRELKDWSLDNYISIKDVGPVVAQNVIHFFDNPDNLVLLDELETAGVNLQQTEADQPKVVDDNAPLVGKTILFTGSLSMSRKEAQMIAERAGAKNISAVSSKLNILVVGEKAGSKLKKARALGSVTIWTEEEFLAQVS